MFQGKKIISLIPLRWGSKSIPYKNIKEIAGKPLCYWVCEAAKRSRYVDGIYASTEDKKIKETVESFGLGIKIADRPPELATDTAMTEPAVLDFMKKAKEDFDLMILLQATSPLTRAADIDGAIEQFFRDECDSMLSGVVMKKFFWTDDGRPMNYDPANRPRRQDFSGVINENGAFYITKKEIWEKYGNRLGGKIWICIIPEYMTIDLDEPDDWPVVEKSLLEHKK